jgi:hypothetical protein
MHANRLNAFVAGDADAIGEVLSGPLGEPALDDANVFRQRAAALVDALAPVLVWMRDHEEVVLNIETVRLSFELSSIWKVATKRVFEVRNPITDETTDIPVPGMPEDLISPLKTYLKRTAGLRHEAGLGPAENRGAGEAACLRPGLLDAHLPTARPRHVGVGLTRSSNGASAMTAATGRR